MATLKRLGRFVREVGDAFWYDTEQFDARLFNAVIFLLLAIPICAALTVVALTQ